MKNLSKSSVEIGHFVSSGTHSSDPSLTYVELMIIYALGLNNEGVIRNPLQTLRDIEFSTANKPSFTTFLEKWATKIPSEITNEKLLEEFGEKIREDYYDLFGVVGMNMPSDSTGTPLLETGELRSKVSYKTTKGEVREHG